MNLAQQHLDRLGIRQKDPELIDAALSALARVGLLRVLPACDEPPGTFTVFDARPTMRWCGGCRHRSAAAIGSVQCQHPARENGNFFNEFGRERPPCPLGRSSEVS